MPDEYAGIPKQFPAKIMLCWCSLSAVNCALCAAMDGDVSEGSEPQHVWGFTAWGSTRVQMMALVQSAVQSAADALASWR
jgi:hypothetical protein